MKHLGAILCGMVLASAYVCSTSAMGIRPTMQTVVKCVYDKVRYHPGVLSTDVFAVGSNMYVIEYKFRRKGRTFTGGLGVHDGVMGDGNYSYTNETPPGQADESGGVELDFLGNTIIRIYEKCHLMPTLDDTMRLPGDPPDDLSRQKIDMSETANRTPALSN